MTDDTETPNTSITLKIVATIKDTRFGLSISFEAAQLTILALVASVITFTLLGAFISLAGYIFGQYLRLTS